MELLTWGGFENLPSFSADDLIAISYLNCARADFVVSPCSNPEIHPTGILPVLRYKDDLIAGVQNIIHYLKKLGFDIDSRLNEFAQAQNIALVNYIGEYMSALTTYVQFLHRPNFDNLLRPLFIKLVGFPLQYYMPLYVRNQIKEDNKKKGISFLEDLSFLSSSRPVYPSGAVFFEQHKSRFASYKPFAVSDEDEFNKSVGKLLGDGHPQSLLRALYIANEVYQVLSLYLDGKTSKCLFGESPTTADIFLAVHLYLQTSIKYPDQVFTKFVQTMHNPLFEYLERQNTLLNYSNLQTVTPETTDKPSLFPIFIKTIKSLY